MYFLILFIALCIDLSIKHDAALLHLRWHLGRVPLAPQLAELTPEQADSKSMLDGMMVSSMPVICPCGCRAAGSPS